MGGDGEKPETSFSLDGSRHDLRTYSGRVRHFMDLVDPRNIMISGSELNSAQSMLTQFKTTGTLPAGVTKDQLFKAKNTVDAVIHPDTGLPIPLPFRMSFFTPSNLPIILGMLSSPPGPTQLFWQWVNQSYNAGFNYANRNASVETSMKDVAMSYVVASGTAVGIAWGGGKVVGKLQDRLAIRSPTGAVLPAYAQPIGLRVVMRAMPWFAVASAGVANALAMRYKEAVDGITVYDADNNPLGTSRLAAVHSLSQIALTRAVLPLPILFLPPFIMDFFHTSKLTASLMRAPMAAIGVEMAVIGACLQFAFPMAVGIFPQRGSVAVASVEEEFQNKGVDQVWFNKGV
ncbi:Sideroflexin-5 [Gonapodya sp. JEL0774]|nr:Sideroflexin-5 [Gonapodya sp. JEL0774]